MQPRINSSVKDLIIALQSLRESNSELPGSTIIVSILLQPLKAPEPMYVTELGIITDVKFVQYKKASLPMLVTEFGIVTDNNPVHPINAHSAICCIPSGIVYTVAYSHGKKIKIFAVYIGSIRAVQPSNT